MEKEKKQPVFILNLLKFLETTELSFASALFFFITAESFGLTFLGKGFVRDMVFFVCSLFLLQSGIVYLVAYGFCRNSQYGRRMKVFLINLTFVPLFLVFAGAIAFLFEPVPFVYRAYALAFLFAIPFSYLFFRRLLEQQFGSR